MKYYVGARNGTPTFDLALAAMDNEAHFAGCDYRVSAGDEPHTLPSGEVVTRYWAEYETWN